MTVREALETLANADLSALAAAAADLGPAGVHRAQMATTRLQDLLVGLGSGLDSQKADSVARMRDIQRAYLELLEVMEYPIDQNGRVHDLNHMSASTLAIAWTSVLYGFRRSAEPLIKKRRINAPGVYANACTWVGVGEPDDAESDLRPGDFSGDRLRPPDVRGLAAVRDGEEPRVTAQWHTTAQIRYTDEPRPEG